MELFVARDLSTAQLPDEHPGRQGLLARRVDGAPVVARRDDRVSLGDELAWSKRRRLHRVRDGLEEPRHVRLTGVVAGPRDDWLQVRNPANAVGELVDDVADVAPPQCLIALPYRV